MVRTERQSAAPPLYIHRREKAITVENPFHTFLKKDDIDVRDVK